MRTSARAIQNRWAFTLIELLMVIVCLGIVALILLPALARPKRATPGSRCRNNLKQVGVAFRVWAIDNGDKYPMAVALTNGGTMELVDSGTVWPHFSVMSNELSTPKILVCPEDAARERWTAATFGPSAPNCISFCSNTNVSYFVGVDGNDTSPQMLLTGDANIGLGEARANSGLQSFRTNNNVSWFQPPHGNKGNIGLADGSVQQVDTPGLRKVLLATGVETNRLAIPASP
jgi:prepilin-type processing-associated H-X9-DG protein